MAEGSKELKCFAVPGGAAASQWRRWSHVLISRPLIDNAKGERLRYVFHRSSVMYIINATPYFPVPSFYLSIAAPTTLYLTLVVYFPTANC